MKATVNHNEQQFEVDLSQPLDISISLRAGEGNLNAWYIDPPSIKAVEAKGFIGDVSKGGNVNFRDIFFNPHGHCTHTECVGHISKEGESVNDALTQFFFLAEVITVEPTLLENGDQVILEHQVIEALGNRKPKALVVRTLPNEPEKKSRQYSHTNPAYVHPDGMKFLVRSGVEHFLIDLPSVDREKDDGQLLSHKAFWEFPENRSLRRTITEFIYVAPEIVDGSYLLNLQMANFENDASPSRPVLYNIL